MRTWIVADKFERRGACKDVTPTALDAACLIF